MGSTDTTRKGRHIDPTNHAPDFVAMFASVVEDKDGWLEFSSATGVRVSILLTPTAERQLEDALTLRDMDRCGE